MAAETAERFLNPEGVLEQIGLQEGMIFADLGCGGGYLSLPAGRFVGETGMVYAVDIQKHVLQNIEGKAKLDNIKSIQTVWADLEIPGSTKIPDNTCDITLLANTLYQSQQPQSMVTEAARITKQGGRLVVIEWKSVDIPLGPAVDQRIEKNDVLGILQQNNLQIEAEFDVGQYHFGISTRK